MKRTFEIVRICFTAALLVTSTPPRASNAAEPKQTLTVCPTGSTCSVTLDGRSYEINGPCDMTNVATIRGCRVIFSIPVGTVNDARLAMLPFAFLTWIVAWCVRYIPFPILNPTKRLAAQLVLAVAMGAPSVLQIVIFRLRAGIEGGLFTNDPLSFAICLLGPTVALGLVLNSAAVLKKMGRATRTM